MAITANRLTYDDLVGLQDLPEYDHARLEIIDGELFVAATPTPFHQWIIFNVVLAFGPIVRSRRLGMLFPAPLTVRFSPERVVEPDIVFVKMDRVSIIGSKVVDGPPDLVMEILSPETRRYDFEAKRHLYEQSGVNEYWIIDPSHRSVTILALVDGQYAEIAIVDGVARSVVAPECSITLDELFEYPA